MSAVSLCAGERSVNSKPAGRLGARGVVRKFSGFVQFDGNLDAGSSIVAVIVTHYVLKGAPR